MGKVGPGASLDMVVSGGCCFSLRSVGRVLSAGASSAARARVERLSRIFRKHQCSRGHLGCLSELRESLRPDLTAAEDAGLKAIG